MTKKITSRPGSLGTNYYDASSHKIGYSHEGILGGMNHYNNNGRKVGESWPGFFGGLNHALERPKVDI